MGSLQPPVNAYCLVFGEKMDSRFLFFQSSSFCNANKPTPTGQTHFIPLNNTNKAPKPASYHQKNDLYCHHRLPSRIPLPSLPSLPSGILLSQMPPILTVASRFIPLSHPTKSSSISDFEAQQQQLSESQTTANAKYDTSQEYQFQKFLRRFGGNPNKQYLIYHLFLSFRLPYNFFP